jgi:hypothetical protein
VGVVVVDVCVTVGQMQDKHLSTCPAKTLHLRWYCLLLEGWTFGTHHTVLVINSDTLYEYVSLQITFLRVYC